VLQLDTQRDLYQGKLARRDARITRLEGRIEQRDDKIHDLERQLKSVRNAISSCTSNNSSRKRARANRQDGDDRSSTVANHYKGNQIGDTLLQLQC
jgi:chromosome segregation ATPase